MVSGPHSKRRNPVILIVLGGEAPQGRYRKKSVLGGVLHKMATQGGDEGVSGIGEQRQMVRDVVLSIASTGETQL